MVGRLRKTSIKEERQSFIHWEPPKIYYKQQIYAGKRLYGIMRNTIVQMRMMQMTMIHDAYRRNEWPFVADVWLSSIYG